MNEFCNTYKRHENENVSYNYKEQPKTERESQYISDRGRTGNEFRQGGVVDGSDGAEM